MLQMGYHSNTSKIMRAVRELHNQNNLMSSNILKPNFKRANSNISNEDI